MHLTRRAFGQAMTAIALVGWSAADRAAGQSADPSAGPSAPEGAGGNTTVSHGLSAFGDLKYPAGFDHFDYADPSAPKGGTWSTGYGSVTYDSFNPFILKGNPAIGVGAFLFDSLMVGAQDEPDSLYGLIAESAELPADRSWVAFNMRPEARFQDGTPLTADDVVFTFVTLRDKGHPSYRLQLAPVLRVSAEGPHRVRYEFDPHAAKRDLPMLVAALPVLSKAYYTAHDFTHSGLDIPLGSGPYTIGRFDPGQNVVFRRDPDYWAAHLPVNAGRWNFDEIRFEYFRDRSAGFEAFKAGAYLFHEEFSSQSWATQYTPQAFPAIARGDVKKEAIPDNVPAGTQGWWFNLRRGKFQDIRVREAIGLAFDFEWSDHTLFYDQYKRTDSFFENGPMQAEGTPTPGEKAILERFADKLPASVLTDPVYVPPTTDGTGRNRRNLHRATELLDAAGWKVVNGLRQKDGAPLQIEFLIGSDGFERITAPFARNLEKIGIRALLRQVDAAQYHKRMQEFAFDITTDRKAMSLTPGVELRDYFSSTSANSRGSENTAGVADPVVDGLIEIIERAKSRQELTDAVKALDRVLRSMHIWVPQWYKDTHSLAYWDIFARPDILSKYARGVIDMWWVDAPKFAAMQAAGKI